MALEANGFYDSLPITPTSLKEPEVRRSMIDVNLVSQSAILSNCQFSRLDIEKNKTEWNRVADLILENLNLKSATELKEAEKIRVFQYYLPIAMWIQKRLGNRETLKPLVVGISAPQGCGKSTIVSCLEYVFNSLGDNVASISIDDFYLTRDEQAKLASENIDNPLLQCRGNAGTHDLDLGTKTLEALIGLTDDSKSVFIPRYDKSAFQGKGDRADFSTWSSIKGPIRLILFEGWMLGFKPLSDSQILSPDLKAINEALKKYESAWDKYVDAWLVIKVGSPHFVFDWRLQAEHAMIALGKSGMTDTEVEDFVKRYMPAYETYLPGLYSEGPTTCKNRDCLTIEVDKYRNPIAIVKNSKSQPIDILASGYLFLGILLFFIFNAK